MLFLSLFCVAAKAHTWRVQRLEMPPRLKYKCTVLRLTRIGSPKKIRLRQLSNPYVVLGYACLLFLSVFGWKKLVVLANSTPVATWTLSSRKDLRNIFDGVSTVLYVAYIVSISMFLGSFLWFVLLLYNILNHVMISDCATLYNIRSILLNHRA